MFLGVGGGGGAGVDAGPEPDVDFISSPWLLEEVSRPNCPGASWTYV